MSVLSAVDNAITLLRLRRHGLTKHLRVFSHTTTRERLALYELAKFLPARATAVEIGSHVGASALFLCEGLKECNGHLYCVDTWMNESMPDGIQDTFSLFNQNTAIFSSMITIIRKNCRDLKQQDIGCDIDLAFIDGDHSERQVRADFDLVTSLVKVGGIAAFHDASSAYPGVNIVIGEALASGKWQLCGLIDSLCWARRLS
jgi:predicted O-methyltransferase YrrM